MTEDFTLVDIVRREPLFVTLDNWFTIPANTKTYRKGTSPVETGMITQAEKDRAAELLRTHYELVLKTADFRVYRVAQRMMAADERR